MKWLMVLQMESSILSKRIVSTLKNKSSQSITIWFFPNTLFGPCVEPVGPTLWIPVFCLMEGIDVGFTAFYVEGSDVPRCS